MGFAKNVDEKKFTEFLVAILNKDVGKLEKKENQSSI